MLTFNATRPVLLAFAVLPLAGCGALGGGTSPDRMQIRAAIEPALACDNAERCARGPFCNPDGA